MMSFKKNDAIIIRYYLCEEKQNAVSQIDLL